MIFSSTSTVSYGQELFICHDPLKKQLSIKNVLKKAHLEEMKQKFKALERGM